ncbi:DNA polymerase IV [Alicyclobacillus tolerans]|uniref:DNA polymerase IV n=1 Tax=Alicyclobacillus tolerans TaxID=90970 RepID=UPI001F00944D|nr:DNA polymerase IV [Alicyclobacillus tolerans]MCF8566188.1 DNA polymerase IV [Alicyclobacillus tolerans]
MSEIGGVAARQILHIDMNAFYCSCHAAAEPGKYKGKPTAVAGSPETRHGVVVTASYEARRRGVRATMTVPEAKKACRELILINPDFDLYRRFSKRVFALIREYTPDVEIFSIDECFADITKSLRLGSPRTIATALQHRILEEIGLPCSVGIAPNKFLAKMASDFQKPMGITEIALDDVPSKLWPLPVEALFGIGEKTAQRLNRLGIRTAEDLAHTNVERLVRTFGKRAYDMWQHAWGKDDSPVCSQPEPMKSIGHSLTLPKDVDNLEELYTVLMNLCDQVGRRLRRHGMQGKTVQITMRYTSRKTVTRARTLSAATDLTEEIYQCARSLLKEHKPAGVKLRLIGVTVSQLRAPRLQRADTAGMQSGQESLEHSLNGQPPNPPALPADFVESGEDAGDSIQLSLFDGVSSSANRLNTASSLSSQRSSHGESFRPPVDAASVGTAGANGIADAANLEKLKRLTQATDELRNKYGENIVVRGRMLIQHVSNQLRDHKARGTSLQKDTLRD